MELRHFRYFVAVAEELSFRKAAARLRVAQPSLGRQIRDLEDEIGVVLFDRDRRHVALTDAGRVLLDEARRLLANADATVRITRDAAKGEAGVLRIGNVGSLSASFLPETLAEFREAFPRVEIEIREMGPDDQKVALVDGALHVGIFHTRPAEQNPQLVIRPIVSSGAWAVLPTQHPLSSARTIALDALADEQFLSYRPAQGAGHEGWFVGLCTEYGHFQPKIRRKVVEHWNTLFGMVAAKEGITIMPSLSVKQVKPSRGWVARPLRVPKNNFNVSAIWKVGTPPPVLANYLPFLLAAKAR